MAHEGQRVQPYKVLVFCLCNINMNNVLRSYLHTSYKCSQSSWTKLDSPLICHTLMSNISEKNVLGLCVFFHNSKFLSNTPEKTDSNFSCWFSGCSFFLVHIYVVLIEKVVNKILTTVFLNSYLHPWVADILRYYADWKLIEVINFPLIMGLCCNCFFFPFLYSQI